ncbi:MAG TPA: DUF362 domain-containing protein, partial [Verrucomicrobiae bacterium]|nr:DUF362 domain-containing protein [Verrucomicrobiae bacterium]
MTIPHKKELMPRRDFIARAAKASVGVAAAGGGALWLHDRKGPAASAAGQIVVLPDFSVPAAGRKMSIIAGADRVKTINRAMQALGGIEQFIKSGDHVVLKVNAAFASPPSLSATANPELIAEVARLCLKAGAASVIVTDNPINDPQSCFVLTGIEKAAKAAGAKLALPDTDSFQPTTVENARLIREWPLLYGPFRGATKLIGIAPVKDHHRSGASMTMKNWYGLLGGRRNIFHQDIHTIIFELAKMVRPTFVILDGTRTMMSNGPTGGSLDDLKATNTMIVSTDQVAADAFGATLLGKTAADLPFIDKAAAAGFGTA